MASFKAKFPVLQELFAKNHRGGPLGPPSGARVKSVEFSVVCVCVWGEGKLGWEPAPSCPPPFQNGRLDPPVRLPQIIFQCFFIDSFLPTGMYLTFSNTFKIKYVKFEKKQKFWSRWFWVSASPSQSFVATPKTLPIRRLQFSAKMGGGGGRRRSLDDRAPGQDCTE